MAITGPTVFLWFDEQALDAAEFYTALFPDSRITDVTHYGPGSRRPEGSVLTVAFEIMGTPFVALNGGPEFTHSEAVSFQIGCDTQAEIDRYWDALVSDGGAESMCGWCKDRFGVSWQVTPSNLGELMAGPDEGAAGRGWAALMSMGRIDIAAIRAAVTG